MVLFQVGVGGDEDYLSMKYERSALNRKYLSLFCITCAKPHSIQTHGAQKKEMLVSILEITNEDLLYII